MKKTYSKGEIVVYEQIFDALIAAEPDVEPGVMMREPALKCRGKVFAFFYQDMDAMCFKLGKNFPIEEHGIADYTHLSPFKLKPPMTAWFVIGRQDEKKWRSLTKLALDQMRAT